MPSAARYRVKGLVRPKAEGEKKEDEMIGGPSLSYSHSVTKRIRKVLASDKQKDGATRAFLVSLARQSFPSDALLLRARNSE